MSYPRHRLARQNKLVKYTAGDIKLDSLIPEEVDPLFDLWIPARNEDVVEFGINTRSESGFGSLELDVAIVNDAGTIIRYVGGMGSSGGIPGWSAKSNESRYITGSVRHFVDVTDLIDEGRLRIKLYGFSSDASRFLAASAAYPMTFWIDNIGREYNEDE